MKHVLIWMMMGGAALAGPVDDVAADADVVIIGEVHDNPAHHLMQAGLVADLQPKAVVFEMLIPDQVAGAVGIPREDQIALEAALGWDASGWPDFTLYHPIFAASDAQLFGAAVPRDVARQVFSDGVEAHFDAAATFGLTQPLPEAEQSARLDLQFEAHCEAMPREALGGMVEVQRLRDASLAQAVVEAMTTVGPPVVVITGNGHARKDWGVPSYLAQVLPEAKVISIGQGEDGGTPEGGFDLVLDAPSVDRPDPCDALR